MDFWNNVVDGSFRIPLGEWVAGVVDWMTSNLDGFFGGVSKFFGAMYEGLSGAFMAPWYFIIVLLFAALAWWVKGWTLAVGTAIGLLAIVAFGQWDNAMRTLSLVIIASAIAILISVPLGIWAARNIHVSRVVRPILDFLQTMPAFVYLIPAVMLFTAGPVPGMVATVIFALAPGVRLTELGIRGVDQEVVEAGHAFGATPGRILRQIQLPLALPSIMAGINQVIMLSLSMVVIAGMVGAEGLGAAVVESLGTLDVGLGVEAGLSVVILAMILDRVTAGAASRNQRVAEKRRAKHAAAAAPVVTQSA